MNGRHRPRPRRHGILIMQTIRRIGILVLISAGVMVWMTTSTMLELHISHEIMGPEPLRRVTSPDFGPPEWKNNPGRSEEEYKESRSSSWEMCRDFDHSIKRPQHGCQVNTDTKTTFCSFDNLRIDTQKIEMESKGGEVLSTVMGRTEKSEFPRYKRGAFSVPTAPTYDVSNEHRQGMHYMEDVLNAMRYPTAKNKGKLDFSCHQTYPGTTLFLTRYEYVNLYHTMTDWWNAFFALPREKSWISKNNEDFLVGMEGIGKADRVVFLDGHAQGLLDPTWESLFGKYHFIQHMGGSGGLCFERAIFVPPGYKSPLYDDKKRSRCPHKGMTKAFSDFVLEQHNLLHKRKVIKGNIVLIDRQPFVSHPRSNPENFLRQIRESDLKKIEKRLTSIPGATVQVVRLETMSFREQLALMQESHIVIGMHGAALTHLLFMNESRSHVIELMPAYQVDFFQYLSEWKGIDFKSFNTFDVVVTMSQDMINEMARRVEKYIRED